MTEAVEQQTAEVDGEIANLEAERAEVERRVAEMQAELLTLQARENDGVTWGESETKLAKRISDAARQRLVLPRMIRAGRVRMLEIDRKIMEQRAAELEEKGQAAYAALREAETALRKAREDHGQAQYEHSDTAIRIQGVQRSIKRIDTELIELKGGNSNDE
jgi:hypothetical protein